MPESSDAEARFLARVRPTCPRLPDTGDAWLVKGLRRGTRP